MEISQTADAALGLMTIIADRHPLSTAQLAEIAGASADTCERQLRTLSRRGYVVLRSDGSWSLGPKLIDLASRVPDRLALAARDEVSSLAQRFATSVLVATAAPPNFRIQIGREGRAGPVRSEHFSGVEFGIWQAPPGLALLPALDSEALAEVELNSPDRSIVATALDSLRRTGVIVAPSELITGRTGVATPITLSDGKIIASITLAFSNLPSTKVSEARTQLLATAKHIADRYEQISMGASVRRRKLRGVQR